MATIEIDRSASTDFLSDGGFVQLGHALATHAIRTTCTVQGCSESSGFHQLQSEACAMVYHT